MTTSPSTEPLPNPPDGLSFEQVRLRFIRIVPGEPAARGLVPSYHFRILIEDDLDVGHISFRVGDTEHIQLSAGHIGYEIRETHRGKGYAYQACRAMAPFVRWFYKEVTITCDPDNEPSIRTILHLGAALIDEVDVPPDDPQYQRGSRRKKRYLWKP